ncbi:hypothetical protein EDB89DRAFT_2130909 [Lactarius sanguifluus]|nr:hypothetical protein EDB89DRAFT_2130909 [Lactarius sanguifluus]
MNSDYKGGNYEDGDEDYGNYDRNPRPRPTQLRAACRAGPRPHPMVTAATSADDGTMLKNWVYCSVCSSSQVIAFVLPSKSSNSLAMWRCKVAVPNSVRLSHLREIELANATLRKDYPVLVDKIRPLPDWPTSLPSKSVPSLAMAKKTTIVSKSTTMADDDNCDSKAATTTT